MKDFRSSFSEFAKSAETTISSVSIAKDRSFGSLVKMDHIIYMQNAYMAVEKAQDCEEAVAVRTDHRNCRLGKWYGGAGKEIFGKTTAYLHLEKPHSEVHSCVQRSIQLSGGDWENSAELRDELVQELKKGEEASKEVISLIDQMVKEKYSGNRGAGT